MWTSADTISPGHIHSRMLSDSVQASNSSSRVARMRPRMTTLWPGPPSIIASAFAWTQHAVREHRGVAPKTYASLPAKPKRPAEDAYPAGRYDLALELPFESGQRARAPSDVSRSHSRIRGSFSQSR